MYRISPVEVVDVATVADANGDGGDDDFAVVGAAAVVVVDLDDDDVE